jgi:hypothetical protein
MPQPPPAPSTIPKAPVSTTRPATLLKHVCTLQPKPSECNTSAPTPSKHDTTVHVSSSLPMTAAALMLSKWTGVPACSDQNCTNAVHLHLCTDHHVWPHTTSCNPHHPPLRSNPEDNPKWPHRSPPPNHDPQRPNGVAHAHANDLFNRAHHPYAVAFKPGPTDAWP